MNNYALFGFIQATVTKSGGFLSVQDCQRLEKIDRLCLVLVRTGNGRFLCPVQNLEHFKKCVDAGGDYVRDVQFPADATERAAAQLAVLAATAGKAPARASAGIDSRLLEDCHSDADPGL